MKTPQWKDQKIVTIEGIEYWLSFEDEHSNPSQHFKHEYGWSDEDYKEISNFYWFCAKVYSKVGDNILSCNYLGACCYKNLKDVMKGHKSGIEHILGGYMPQMIEECREEAHIAKQELISKYELSLKVLKNEK